MVYKNYKAWWDLYKNWLINQPWGKNDNWKKYWSPGSKVHSQSLWDKEADMERQVQKGPVSIKFEIDLDGTGKKKERHQGGGLEAISRPTLVQAVR